MAAGSEYSVLEIRPLDILFGKGKNCTDHIGSIAYKAMLEARIPFYMDPRTESCDKTYMTVEMVEGILNDGGRFLREKKKGSGVWIELDKGTAREKVRDGFRDAVKSARKKQHVASFLSRIGFNINVTRCTSYLEVIKKVSQDPSMMKFLDDSQEIQSKAKKKNLQSNSVCSLTKDLHQTARVREAIYLSEAMPESSSLSAPPFTMPSSQIAAVTPLHFVPISVPSQLGMPSLSLAATGPSCTARNIILLSDDIQRLHSHAPVPQFSAASVSKSTNCMIDPQDFMSTCDDPWGEGGFEEAGSSCGNDLLASLERADRIVNEAGVSFPDDCNDQDFFNHDDEQWLDSLDSLIDDGRQSPVTDLNSEFLLAQV